MSDYIYNNNFSSAPDKDTSEPVNLYFEVERSKQKPLKKKVIALICSLCVLFSGIAGATGALIVNSISNSRSQYSNIVASVVYKSPFELSGVASDTLFQNKSNEGKETYTATQVVKIVENSVVEIRTQYASQSNYQYVTSGAGSGVIIGRFVTEGSKNAFDGYYIITNAHVITDSNGKAASSIMVELKNGTIYKATVKGYDTDGDIAVLMISESKNELTCASFISNSDDIAVGEDVIAIGNPLGKLGGSVTAGIISALDREIDVDGTTMNLLQTNAAINPGNSGGGLFNMSGELIGIVNAKSTGTDIEGIGFAIPANDAYRLAEEIIKYGYVKKPYIGITSRLFNGKIYIFSIYDGVNAGVLQVGDVIVSVEGVAISSTDDIAKCIRKAKIGDKLDFEIIRNGETIHVEVTVFEKPQN